MIDQADCAGQRGKNIIIGPADVSRTFGPELISGPAEKRTDIRLKGK